MRLYIDEDLASRHLCQALIQAGHDVTSTIDCRLRGESDSLQLTHAVREDRVLLTRNARDFRQLHLLITVCGGSHPGIFTVHSENVQRREMKPGQVIAAIQHLGDVLASVRNMFLNLNDWR